jgi:hypothetical protein
MAFTPETLCVIAQPIGGVGMRLVSYRSDDSEATITGGGYFVAATGFGLRRGDLLFVSPITGPVDTYVVIVNSVDADGNATGVVAELTDSMPKLVYDPQGIQDDAFDRANHTGTQDVATITGLGTAATENSSAFASSTRAVATQHSLAGGGDLSTDRTLSLVNDTSSPGNNKVYGTDGSGARGWKNDPSGGGIPGAVTPEAYGAVGDGTTDDSAAINAAIVAAGIGGTVLFDSKVYACASTIVADIDGITLRGTMAADIFGQDDSYTQGSVLKWTGASGGHLLYHGVDADGTEDLKGGGLHGLLLDGNSLADLVLHTRSTMNAMYSHLFIGRPRDNSGAICWFMDSDEQARAGVNSVYGCLFEQIVVATGAGAAHGIWITGADDETTGRHPAFCTFGRVHITHDDGRAVYISSADNLTFVGLGISKVAGGTGDEIFLDGDTANANQSVQGVLFVGLQVTTNDTPTIRATGSRVNNCEIVGLQEVDLAPTLVITGDADLGFNNKGTGTPTLTFGGATTGITYTTRSMSWARVGKLCTVTVAITLSSKGSATGVASIGGLPFTTAAFPILGGASIAYYANLAAGIEQAPTFLLTSSETFGTLYKGGAGSSAGMSDTDFTNTSRLEFTVTYLCA